MLAFSTRTVALCFTSVYSVAEYPLMIYLTLILFLHTKAVNWSVAFCGYFSTLRRLRSYYGRTCPCRTLRYNIFFPLTRWQWYSNIFDHEIHLKEVRDEIAA